jgi:hypothetical protein
VKKITNEKVTANITYKENIKQLLKIDNKCKITVSFYYTNKLLDFKEGQSIKTHKVVLLATRVFPTLSSKDIDFLLDLLKVFIFKSNIFFQKDVYLFLKLTFYLLQPPLSQFHWLLILVDIKFVPAPESC